MDSPKAEIVLKENPLYDNSDSASSKSKKETHPDVMSVMMADITVEAAIAEMERKVNFLMKVVEERDHEITTLREQMQTHETTKSSQTPVVKATDKGKNVVQENKPQQQSISVASLSVQQLQDIIANSIRAQYGGPLQTSFMYSKPYTKRIDNLRMPLGYQPLKFQKFDGKGNPKQHIAHFVETCENAGSRGGQLVRQFIRSLKESAFECTRLVVSMMELTNTKQRKGEPIIDYINRWRALSLDCKDKLTELSAVEMCPQEKQLIQLPECKRPEQAGKVDDPNCCNYHRVISHPVEKCFVLKKLILKLARENKIELDIDEVAQTNHVAVNMTSSVLPSILLYDQRESLIQFETFESILVRFQQKIMTSNSQNKEEPIEDEGEEWIVMARQKGRQTNSIQTKLHFHQKHSKGSISHKNKGKRNKKMSKPKPIKGKDEDFLRPRRLITLTEFFPRSFLEGHLKEILEVTACYTTSIIEVDNNYVSSKEIENSNEIKQRIFVFNRIKPSTTRSSVFQRLSLAMKEEENQCPMSTFTRTSAFKRLNISTSKKDRPSTSVFYRLKMTNDQQREMKILKTKIFHEENNDDRKIHSRVPSRMKRKLSVDISTECFLTVKPRLIIYTNSTNEKASFVFLKKLHRCFFKFKFKSFKLHRCSQEAHHLKYVAVEKVVILNMLQLRRSISQTCYSREVHRLKYVVTEKVIVSNMLQPRRSSSQICCNQEIRHLKYVAAEKVVVSNMLQPRRSLSQICCSREGRRLKYVAPGRSTPSSSCGASNHHLRCAQSSSSMSNNADDHHLQCNATQAIIIFNNAAQTIIIFKVAQS
ncbi:ty3-gypsy retrotransposon protein [Cucumis melo var. makuwa]|uniref:Ty3-gypsy retrotransposon protein n=1 Tax=Cucumis melo var. makuwa TaxID=1194695 RepID=A0A5D3C8K3_CUCMM|nr:ty3-gypsy retrotransposon protein [Cucumis melo var. makuwa]